MDTELTGRESQLIRAAQRYQSLRDSGKPLDRGAFLEDHRDLAEELTPYLEAIDALCSINQGKVTPASPELAESAPLGDFQILREIGRGGMGVVYEARQMSLGRKVALKVLSLAGTLDPRQLQRFKNEAQAAAHLHHTNIVPVYAVGCERGVHFYAMQLIEGHTLAELIAQLRHGRTEEYPRPSAETQARLETWASATDLGQGQEAYRSIARLMVQAAEALDHAHEQGVVHRDIKPANLILDGRGHLWITDFGLAQFQDGIDLTRTGDLVGTLRYMSPEQASGQRILLDHRTDLYSLGATFYEVLVLEPVFTGQTRVELLRQIAHDDPRPMRALRQGVPPELETIVLKCLSKSPGDRYPTARELADDLKRFLDNVPIKARRPGLIERARKWGRRHPGVLAGAGLILLITTIGLLVSNALVSREQGRTKAALDGEKRRAEQAERRLRQTRQLVDLLIQLGEEELDDRPEHLALRKRLMETALTHYQQLLDDSLEDEEAATDLTAARERVQHILSDLITMQGAELSFLLLNPGVLDELELDDEQRARIKDLLGDSHRRRWETLFSPDLSPSARRQALLEVARREEQVIRSTLLPAQVGRLRQISLQVKGPGAFRDPDVVKELRLTAEQRRAIREIEKHGMPGWDRPPGPPSREGAKGPGRSGHPVPFEKLHREKLRRCLALLKPDQQAAWENLTGKPFTLQFSFWPRPGGPPNR